MKKILFAALAALAITSCSQNEEIEKAVDKAEINFNTAVVARATTTTTTTFKEFKVYAYTHTDAFDGTTVGTSFIDGAGFTKNESTWESEGGKFYWPTSGKVSFFAYSPKAASATIAQATGAPTLTYSVKATPTEQEDLVVAQNVDQAKAASGTTPEVSLTFKHALTKVAFKVRGTDDKVTYTVTQITVKAKSGGTYTYATTATELGNWAPNTTEESYDVLQASETALSFVGSDKTGADIPAANIEDLVTADKTLMLIPQSGVTVEVTYKAAYTTATDGSSIHPSGKETIQISDTWKAGENYVYTLILKPGEEIGVTAELADNWDKVTSNNDASME